MTGRGVLLTGHDPRLFKTFGVRTTPAHWRAARCDEVPCRWYREGWVTRVDIGTERGAAQAWYLRHDSGRSFTEEQVDARTVLFRFAPGQPCFRQATHRKRVAIGSELFVARDGNRYGNPTGRARRHANADDWRDDMACHLDRVRTVRERG